MLFSIVQRTIRNDRRSIQMFFLYDYVFNNWFGKLLSNDDDDDELSLQNGWLTKILFPGGANARDFHHEFRFMIKFRVCFEALFITTTSYSPGTGVFSP